MTITIFLIKADEPVLTVWMNCRKYSITQLFFSTPVAFVFSSFHRGKRFENSLKRRLDLLDIKLGSLLLYFIFTASQRLTTPFKNLYYIEEKLALDAVTENFDFQ